MHTRSMNTLGLRMREDNNNIIIIARFWMMKQQLVAQEDLFTD